MEAEVRAGQVGLEGIAEAVVPADIVATAGMADPGDMAVITSAMEGIIPCREGLIGILGEIIVIIEGTPGIMEDIIGLMGGTTGIMGDIIDLIMEDTMDSFLGCLSGVS